MARPLIGICPNFKEVGGRTDYFLNPHYAAIISGSGALPIILPLVENRQGAREILDRVDGLVLTGGGLFRLRRLAPPGSAESDLAALNQAIFSAN